MSPGTEEFAGSSNAHVQEVVKAAEESLRQLIRQRADIVKRIGTIKQTIVGLANIFGDDWLGEELWELVSPRDGARQRGVIKAPPHHVDGGDRTASQTESPTRSEHPQAT